MPVYLLKKDSLDDFFSAVHVIQVVRAAGIFGFVGEWRKFDMLLIIVMIKMEKILKCIFLDLTEICM